jgi:hypothetical protein
MVASEPCNVLLAVAVIASWITDDDAGAEEGDWGWTHIFFGGKRSQQQQAGGLSAKEGKRTAYFVASPTT